MSPRINDRQVEAFRATVASGSITRAANHLHITQPAVSRLLKDFEIEIGFSLFDRVGRGIQVTKQGAMLYDEVVRSHIGLRSIRDYAIRIHAGTVGHLRVVCMPAFADTFVAPAVGRFLRGNPSLSVTVDVQNTNKIVEGIAREQFDVGIATPSLESPKIQWETLRSRPMVAVMHRNHPLANVRAITANHLCVHGVLILPDDSPYQMQLRMAVAKHGKNLPIKVAATFRTQSAACTALVHGAPALAVVDPLIAEQFKKRLKCLPLGFPLQSSMSLCTVNGNHSQDLIAICSMFRDSASVSLSD
jgi:DNA-binding transcriptional LysR family regulator